MSKSPSIMPDASSFSEKENCNHASSADQQGYTHKRPAFVLIDDRQGQAQYTYFGQSDEFSQKKEAKTNKKLSLRLICLLGWVFCLVFSVGVLLGAIALTLLATFSLFRNAYLNQRAKSVWKIYVHTILVGLGFALGILSPTLGFGSIALYFSFCGEGIREHLLHKVFHRFFYTP